MGGPVEPEEGTSLVGRGAELDTLRAAVDAALRGEGAGAVVVGEAGIGKSRLVTEVARRPRAAGSRVVWSRAWEPGGGPSHWHWVQILRSLAAGQDRRALLDAVDAGAEELARLVPDLRAGLQLAAPGDPEGDDPRYKMYEAVSSFLRRESARHPLLLVLDDLHAADLGSLRLLRFVMTETRDDPLAVVAVTRDPDTEYVRPEIADALLEVRRVGDPLHLGGLDRLAVEEMLRELVGAVEASRRAPEIHRRAAGNPLFVRELGHLLAADPHRGVLTLPGTIRALLERRLAAVPGPSLEILRLAAVVGDEFSIPLLQQVADLSRQPVLDAVGDGVRARLVGERHGTAFEFNHALVREVLYEQLPLPERARAHRRVAEALERRGGAHPPVAELAHHFLAGAPAVEDGKAAHYAELAGQRAARQLAYEDAARHFRRALSALALDGADTTRHLPVLLALGDAALRSGDIEEARDAFVQAADHARRQGRPDLFAQAALGLGSGLDGFEVRLFDHAQITLLEEAIDLLGPAPSALRSWAMARLSVALTFAETQPRRLQLADDAAAAARTVDDPRALAYALAARCDAIAGPEHVDRRLDAATEIARLARSAGDRGMELLGRRNRVIALLESGDIGGVDDEIDRYELLAEAIGQPLYQWYVPLWRGMRALMDGRIDAAHAHRRAAATIGARAQSHNAALNADVLAWNTFLKEARWPEAADALSRQLELADGIYGEPFWVALVVPYLHPAEARAALDRFAANGFAAFPRDAVWLAAMTYAADAAGVLGHAQVAEQLYELILPYRSRFAVDAIGAACYGSMERPLGVLAAVLARRAEAEAHFEAALHAHRASGASALVAETLHDLGRFLVALGEGRRGEVLQREARALYQALGMTRRAALVSTSVPAGAPSEGMGIRNVFRLDGDYWTLGYKGRTVRVADSKGLRDIAILLGRPGQDVHVADLIAATDPASGRAEAGLQGALLRETTSDEVLDHRARSAYRARLAELREELEEAAADADLARAELARSEMDAIAGELAAALGLGGRSRTQSDAGERARKAVTQRIRNSVKRLATAHPELASHLDRSVRTGRFCSYAPEQPVEWSRGE